MGRGFEADLEGLIRCVTLVYGLTLFAVTLIKIYKGSMSMWYKVLITMMIILLLFGHIMGFLPVRSVTVTTDQTHQIILPSKEAAP
jgi:hypothetical protein